ncbi:MAG: LacI family transcriptional regulator [Actinomycetota bacterium]|nr:LacI family transcriptional regulator [Actinomycetota bacterium]
MARLADVAAAAGVSLATASRVLSGSVQPVSLGLHERVLDAARRLQYVPNAHAQALVRSTTSTVGLIVHDGSDPYFSEIARGVFRAAREHDLLVLICNTYREPASELRYISALRAQRVQAVLLAGSGFTRDDLELQTSAELHAFQATGGRVVLVGRHRAAFDSVLPDNTGGAHQMTHYLLAAGHERIGVIAGPGILTTIEDRLKGVREALSELGLVLADDRLVSTPQLDRDSGHAGAGELLAKAPDITAIFALNDTMAVGALAALRERGVRVPDDISIVGFDDIPTVRDVTPPLTTVRLPMEAMGAHAMTLALRSPAKQPRRVPMSAWVVERESVAPPRPRRRKR